MAAKLGERHHAATCTDHDVALAVELVQVHGLSRRAVAKKFEVSHQTVALWVRGVNRMLRRRAR